MSRSNSLDTSAQRDRRMHVNIIATSNYDTPPPVPKPLCLAMLPQQAATQREPRTKRKKVGLGGMTTHVVCVGLPVGVSCAFARSTHTTRNTRRDAAAAAAAAVQRSTAFSLTVAVVECALTAATHRTEHAFVRDSSSSSTTSAHSEHPSDWWWFFWFPSRET